MQYFERAVFELHPENAAPYDVLLSLLGSIRYNQRYVQPKLTPGPTTPQPTQAPVETGGDWPMYGHDLQRTGYNPDKSLISADNVGQLVSRWQVYLGSNGNPSSSTPSVALGRVYVGSSVPTGPNYFAFDARTGAPEWSADLGYTASCEKVGIGSTAAISGTVLAVGGGDGAYYGLDAQTGATLWRNPLGAGASGMAWVSPLLAYGRAYVGVASYCDNPPVRGQIRAVDLLNGQVLASQYIVPASKAGGGIWNSPALSPDGRILAITTGEDNHGDDDYTRSLMTLNPLSLDIMQVDQQGTMSGDLDYASSPVIFHDRSNRVLVGGSHKDNHFYAYELGKVDQGAIWSRQVQLAIGMLPAYDPSMGEGGALFLTGRDGTLYTIDPATGSDLRPPVPVGKLHGNLAIANGLIFVDFGDAGLSIYNERDGRLLRTIVPDHAAKGYTGVAVAHGFIYWVSGGYLNAWSLP